MVKEIADEVRRFILTSIDSVQQMEALVIFHSHQENLYQAEHLSKILYISPALAKKILQQLESKGLIELSDDITAQYRLNSTSEKSSLIDLVVETYRTNLIEVTNLIHRKQDPLYQFSEAFKIGKER